MGVGKLAEAERHSSKRAHAHIHTHTQVCGAKQLQAEHQRTLRLEGDTGGLSLSG